MDLLTDLDHDFSRFLLLMSYLMLAVRLFALSILRPETGWLGSTSRTGIRNLAGVDCASYTTEL